VRRTLVFPLVVALLAGSGVTLAQDPSPGPSASPLPSAAPPGPTDDPCAVPLPVPSGSPSVDASVLPGTSTPPASSTPATHAPGTSVEPGHSPAPSSPVEPSIDPCATPAPSAAPSPGASAAPEVGFQPNRVRIELVRIADGLELPVYLSGTGDGSGDLFIVERAGRVRILSPGGRLRTFLDIRDRVDTLNERGLHAIALHPRYATNGRFYVHYNTSDGDTNIVEYEGLPGDGQVAAGSGRTILRLAQPFENHNGGWIGFGPDGMLYIALGDGGGNSPGDPLGNGQRRSTLLAKILRIDVNGRGRYTIPEDNPYPNGERGFAPETWSWGLRNPWRASFDRETGDLWIGDVGQDLVEEIDLAPAGKGGLNFGWSEMEGSECHQGRCDPRDFTLPVTEYRHGTDGCSVVGGYVYRGEAQPLLRGAYLFSDFCSGKIWGIRADEGKAGAELRPRQLFQTNESTWVSFGEDDAGELYAVSFGGGIYRIEAKPRG
jgi:glucose/arabinose dehydrogenase